MASQPRESRTEHGRFGWLGTTGSRWLLLIVALVVLTALAVAAFVFIDRDGDSGQPNLSAGVESSPPAATLPAGIEPWPVHTANPDNLSLHLSQTTVRPGQIITRTITGGGPNPDIVTSADIMLDARMSGEWRTLYFLGVAAQDPGSIAARDDISIPAIGLPPTALSLRIPDLPPGTYRLRQDVSSKSGPTTLYTTITVEPR